MSAPETTVVTPLQFTAEDIHLLQESIEPTLTLLAEKPYFHSKQDGISFAFYDGTANVTTEVNLLDHTTRVEALNPAQFNKDPKRVGNTLSVFSRGTFDAKEILHGSTASIKAYAGFIRPAYRGGEIHVSNLYEGRSPEDRAEVRAAFLGKLTMNVDNEFQINNLSGFLIDKDYSAAPDVLVKQFVDWHDQSQRFKPANI